MKVDMKSLEDFSEGLTVLELADMIEEEIVAPGSMSSINMMAVAAILRKSMREFTGVKQGPCEGPLEGSLFETNLPAYTPRILEKKD